MMMYPKWPMYARQTTCFSTVHIHTPTREEIASKNRWIIHVSTVPWLSPLPSCPWNHIPKKNHSFHYLRPKWESQRLRLMMFLQGSATSRAVLSQTNTHTQRKCNLQAPTWRDQHVVSKKSPLSDQYGFWSKAHVRMNVHNNDRIYHYDWIMGLSSTIWLDSWGLLGWFGSTECFFCFPKMVLVRQSVPNLN